MPIMIVHKFETTSISILEVATSSSVNYLQHFQIPYKLHSESTKQILV